MRSARHHVPLRAMTLLIALVVLAGPSVTARTQERHGFVLIANRGNPVSTLTRGEVSRLFLSRRSRWPGGRTAEPVDQVESSPVRRLFTDAIHGMDVPSVKSFWQELVFSGKDDPPPERASDEDVIAFVKAHPDAIGYIGGATHAQGVKIIVVTR